MAGGSPGRTELEAIFVVVDDPFNGHVPALRYAESFKDAHGGDFRRSVFSDDLAYHELQGEAMLALLLLGHVTKKAANCEGIAGLLALAQAELKLEHAAVGSVVAQGGAVDTLSIEGAPEVRSDLATASGREELFKGIYVEEL